jgi:hypothetical protein
MLNGVGYKLQNTTYECVRWGLYRGLAGGSAGRENENCKRGGVKFCAIPNTKPNKYIAKNVKTLNIKYIQLNIIQIIGKTR